jgi:hypothetical protein
VKLVKILFCSHHVLASLQHNGRKTDSPRSATLSAGIALLSFALRRRLWANHHDVFFTRVCQKESISMKKGHFDQYLRMSSASEDPDKVVEHIICTKAVLLAC